MGRSFLRRFSTPCTAGLLLLALASRMASAAGDAKSLEIVFPGDAFAKLDTFEGLNLQDADKLFGKKDYKGAYAAYKAYSSEFSKSQALPYVLLRMGRCLHLQDQRNAAIKAYQDVVDYFPNDVRYAAAALFYIGECHGQNGDDQKKTAVWARMVKDDGYVGQPNSGTALTYLAQEVEKLGKFEESAEFNWRTAVTFLKSNERAAADARKAVIFHYVMRNPNHEKLTAFYTAASGFDGKGGKVDKPQDEIRYWDAVLDTLLRPKDTAQDLEKACSYWSVQIGDRFVDNDGMRKRCYDVMLVHEKDRAKWVERMEKQFARKPADLQRVLQWCDFYEFDPTMRAAFFAKQSAPLMTGMKFNEQMNLMEKLRHLRMHDEAQKVMRSVSMQGLSNEEIKNYTAFAAHYCEEEEVLRLFARITDASFAAKARLDYYYARSDRNRPFMEKALAEIPNLKKDPKYSGQNLAWIEADLLRGTGRYEEAIKAYQAANKQPQSTWAVTDCMVALKQYDQAIKNVQGLESIGGSVASQACLKVADIHRISGDKGKEVSQLRLVLRRYPKSTESSEAHQRLEKYGAKISGGEDKADE